MIGDFNEDRNYMLGVGNEFHDIFLQGVDENNSIVEISNMSVPEGDNWQVIFFYPKDFTFICPTEIAKMDKLIDEGVSVFGISGDNEYCKLNWKQTNDQIKDIRYPLLADCGLRLAGELGIVNTSEGVCYRATYIVDPHNIIQHVSVNELDTGRNVEEIIRTVKALQAGGKTGCDWEPGDDLL